MTDIEDIRNKYELALQQGPELVAQITQGDANDLEISALKGELKRLSKTPRPFGPTKTKLIEAKEAKIDELKKLNEDAPTRTSAQRNRLKVVLETLEGREAALQLAIDTADIAKLESAIKDAERPLRLEGEEEEVVYIPLVKKATAKLERERHRERYDDQQGGKSRRRKSRRRKSRKSRRRKSRRRKSRRRRSRRSASV